MELLCRLTVSRGLPYSYSAYLSRAHLAPFVPTPQMVAERAIAMLRIREADSFADLGCGDGRVALEAVHACPGASVTGIDADERTLDLARENVLRLQLRSAHSPQIALRCADVLHADLSRFNVFYAYLSSGAIDRVAAHVDKTVFAPGTDVRFVSCEYPVGNERWQAREVVQDRCSIMGLTLYLYAWRTTQ